MTHTINKQTPDYDIMKYEDVMNCKKSDFGTLLKDWKNLVENQNGKGFSGNKIIYHFMLNEMLKTRRDKKNYKTIEEMFSNEDDKKKLIDLSIKLNRRKKLDYIEPVDIYEAHRLCYGSINTFKATQVRQIIDEYGGTHLLDPTAGWGGRMLGALSKNIHYTGIDTNENLEFGYSEMMNFIPPTARGDARLILDDCFNVDFEAIDYDLVLTSPPYFNLEKYSHFKEFDSEASYYKDWLIPLIDRLRKHIKRNGKVCINISDYMFRNYIKYGGENCKATMDLNQQMGGKKNKEMIYIW
jgi:hypothetical protein